jgi:hypothetical protein
VADLNAREQAENDDAGVIDEISPRIDLAKAGGAIEI